jgi:AraC-like DNA-binding protein
MERVPFGERNHVLQARARQHYWTGEGPLSVKTFTGGHAVYEGEGRHLVDDASYLILNEGQPYTITIDANTPVESFCVFFAPGFVSDVLRSATNPHEALLEEPYPPDTGTVHFVERTYPHDRLVTPALRQLRTACTRWPVDRTVMDERLHDLASAMMGLHLGVLREMTSISAIRASTREELYRRLHRSRDYIEASYGEDIGLDTMARIAGIAPHYFLRVFKSAFHLTPHQYLTQVRLRRAQTLLLQTRMPVTEICFAVGFTSLGSFSSLFHRQTGLSPQAYRSQKSKIEEVELLAST